MPKYPLSTIAVTNFPITATPQTEPLINNIGAPPIKPVFKWHNIIWKILMENHGENPKGYYKMLPAIAIIPNLITSIHSRVTLQDIRSQLSQTF